MGGVHRALTQTTARAHPMASAHIAALARRGGIDKSVQFCTDGINIALLAFGLGFLRLASSDTPKTCQAPFCRNLPRCSPAPGLECGVGAQVIMGVHFYTNWPAKTSEFSNGRSRLTIQTVLEKSRGVSRNQ
jgi:hypothetical protein